MLKFICMRLAALSAGYAASLESRWVQTTYTSSQSSFIIAGFKDKSTPQVLRRTLFESMGTESQWGQGNGQRTCPGGSHLTFPLSCYII